MRGGHVARGLVIVTLLAVWPPGAGVLRDFALCDVNGKAHTAAEWTGKKAVVLVFLGTECPVSNFYCPELARTAREYTNQGVAFYGVHADPDVTAEQAARHAVEFRLPFPVLLDPKHRAAGPAGIRVVPETVVLSPDGRVRYRGRIDDRYALDGKKRDEPSSRDLENAIRSVVNGKEPPVAVTKAFGCPVTSPKTSGERGP
jgi:peroxiredoxin